MKRNRGIFLTPKLYVLLVLIAITLISMFNAKDVQGQISNIVASVLTGAVFDILVGVYQKRKSWFPDGALVTALIIALVLSAATPWYMCSLITVISLLSKHVLKKNRKPLFNPAAFGLTVAIVLFSSMESWWGGLAMLPTWCIIFVLIGGYLVVNRVNKFPLLFGFLGTYFLFLLIMGYLHVGSVGDALRTPFLNSTLFLAFFMLTDPPTSPARYRDQIVYGMIAAVVSGFLYTMFGWLGYLLGGLLVANAWNFVVTKKPVISNKSSASVAVQRHS